MTTGTRKAKSKPTSSSVAVAYVRVSTTRQAESGLSLEQQERTLVAAIEAAGYTALVVREEGRSGKNMRNRPALQEALGMLARGEAAALYVAKMDRLARNAAETLLLADEADRRGWRLVALDLALDTATPVGRLVMTVLAAVAEMERSRISERHRDAHAARRARGEVWGVTTGPRPELPAQVRERIADEQQQGKSLRAIAATLNAEQVPTARGGIWHASTIAHVLRSPSLAA